MLSLSLQVVKTAITHTALVRPSERPWASNVTQSEAVHKKSLFPVQRVAVVVASSTAATFVPTHFFLFGRKKLSIFRGKKLFLQKLKKKSPQSHPATPPETEFKKILA